MKAYRVVWLAVCATLAMVGVSVLVVLSPAALAWLFLASAVVGTILTLAVVTEEGARHPRARTRLMVRSALVGGTVTSALIGFSIILGAGVLLLGLCVLISSPYAVSIYGHWLGSAPTPSAAQLDALAHALAYANPEPLSAQPTSELRLLTDEQLCQGWRASYLALQARSSAEQILRTVEERQRYLDEFERRNPRGLTAWLASGARAAGNPLPYLSVRRADRPGINWDELARGQDW